LRAVAVILAALATSPVVRGQEFEVASIRPNRSGAAQMVIRTPPSGQVRASNVTVLMLVRYAYDLPEFRILAAPGWTRTDHFDVAAKAPSGATVSDIRRMFQSLLETRFALQLRREARNMAVDVLRFAGSGPGPGLVRRAQPCGADAGCGVRPAFGRITGIGSPLTELASALTFMERRMVEDATGSADLFDFTLQYTPDAFATLVNPAVARPQFPRLDPNQPALTEALRDQLGLVVERRRKPVDVLVVERVEHPTPN
jgi:uncharacterized protein (TIGR03435 family)